MNKGSFPEKLREIFKTNINKIFQKKFFKKMNKVDFPIIF